MACSDDASLETPEEPELVYIWRWFSDLSDWREQGWGFGPLSHQELEAWARLMRVDIYPSEVEAIRQLDRAVRQYYYKKQNPDPPSISEQLQAVKQASEETKRGKRK